jgi:phosphatidylserine/phosphatidylglycerophosphate/cardiolipin synthase-like enzyme
MAVTNRDTIETYFLCEGCQSGETVARKLASFFSEARHTIDICAYSFHLEAEYRDILVAALQEREQAGVQVRIAYDAGTQQVLYPPGRGYDTCIDKYVTPGGYAGPNTPRFVQSLPFTSRAIEGARILMHHKYVVVDSDTPRGMVWTGSANFTDESFEMQDNNILILRSQGLARVYQKDFDELWRDSHIKSPGLGDSGEATLWYGEDPAYVLVNFAPGEGEWMDEMVARQIERTRERVTLAFVVLTSTRMIRALLGLIKRKVPFEGVYDFSQMEGVKYQWKLVPQNHWKIPAFERIVDHGKLVGKKSTPYTPTSVHDYMHNKIMVLDDITISGSYNFSRNAQRNAENLLLLSSAPLARTYRDYINRIAKVYYDEWSVVGSR